jgi:hypothetical protein
VISGTPTVISPATGYTVTATNSGGSTTATVTITVNDGAPTSLTYSTNPATYTKGQTITDNTPSSGGGAVISYSISPALPAGLSFNTSTGVISGTPTVISPATGYTVTASNSGGSTTATVTITVNDGAPTSLTYSTNPATYTKGQTITNNTPSSGGGAVISYSISPALPAGLSFNTSTGVISGTPTAISPATSYTVTASNSGGSTTATVAITVNDVSCTPPAAPSTQAATNVTFNSFTANWSSVTGATDYRLDVSTSNTFTTYVSGYHDLSVGNMTSFTVTGLSAQTTYYYRVRSYNGCAASPNSNVKNVQTLPCAAAAPSAQNATNVTFSSFTANWSSVSGAIDYHLDVLTNNTYVPGYQDLDVGNTTSFAVTGLSPQTTYSYRVRAYNGCGTSINSNVKNVQTAPCTPAAPNAQNATNVSFTYFTANWSSVSGATGYMLDVFNNGSCLYCNVNVGNTTSSTVFGLSPQTAYSYRVRAYNGCATSLNSNVKNVQTAPCTPTAPNAQNATNVTNSSFSAHWNSVSGATEYFLDVSTSNTFTTYVTGYHGFDAGNATSSSVTGLSAQTTYYYRVRAYNGCAMSLNSSVKSVHTAP